MSNINTGGPAFPCPPNETTKKQCEAAGITYYAPTGMTLRDYFAAKAMLAGGPANKTPAYDDATRAKYAYELADAMLKARDE